MNIALMSGAYKNAGDFLIVKRTKELLQAHYPECKITEYERRKPLDDKMEEINRHDLMLLAGGPGYSAEFYPKSLPLVQDLSKIKIGIVPFGMGWYGESVDSRYVQKYRFSEKTSDLFKKIDAKGISFGCRDWHAVNVLYQNGFQNTVMTGCPAWYDLKYIDQLDFLKEKSHKEIKTICVSDPAKIRNFGYIEPLLKYLRKTFPESKIIFVFHRGVGADKNTMAAYGKIIKNQKNKIEEMGIQCEDIAYSADGFQLYDECDMHIGFRVHAHIYNMSHRNLSILIEEDSRGNGVNQALGLPHIETDSRHVNVKNVNLKKVLQKTINQNKYMIDELDQYLTSLDNSNYIVLKQAFWKMHEYYAVMSEYVKKIETYIF